MIGIPLVTIVYLLTNIAYIAVVGGERILTSGAVAMVSESVSMTYIFTVFVVTCILGSKQIFSNFSSGENRLYRPSQNITVFSLLL